LEHVIKPLKNSLKAGLENLFRHWFSHLSGSGVHGNSVKNSLNLVSHDYRGNFVLSLQAGRGILAGACWAFAMIKPRIALPGLLALSPYLPAGMLARSEALSVLAFLAPMATAFFYFLRSIR
jgi:hypothetical protein